MSRAAEDIDYELLSDEEIETRYYDSLSDDEVAALYDQEFGKSYPTMMEEVGAHLKESLGFPTDAAIGLGTDMARGLAQMAGNAATYVGTGIGEGVAALQQGEFDPALSGLNENLDRFNTAFEETVPRYESRTETGGMIREGVSEGLHSLRQGAYEGMGAVDEGQSPEEAIAAKVSQGTDNPYAIQGAKALPIAAEMIAMGGVGRAAGSGVARRASAPGRNKPTTGPVTDIEAADILKSGDMNAIIEAADIDLSMVRDAKNAGMSVSEIPISSLMRNEAMSRMAKGMEQYGPESSLKKTNQLVDDKLVAKVDDLLDDYNTFGEAGVLDDAWRAEALGAYDKLRQSGIDKRKLVKESVGKKERIETPAMDELGNRFKDVDYEGSTVPPLLKPLVRKSTEMESLKRVFGDTPNAQGQALIAEAAEKAAISAPDLFDLQTKLRKTMQSKQTGNVPIDKVYDALEAVEADMEAFLGGRATPDGTNLLELHNQSKIDFTKSYQLEENMVTMLANGITKSLVEGVKSNISSAAKGNVGPLRLALSRLKNPDLKHDLKPTQTQKYEASTDLKATTEKVLNKAFQDYIQQEGLGGYTQLKRTPIAANMALKEINPQLRSVLNSLELMGKKIVARSKKGGRPLSSSEFTHAMGLPMTQMETLINGLATTYIGSFRVMGAARGARWVKNIQDSHVQRTIKLIESAPFQKAWMRHIEGKSVGDSLSKIENGPIYKRWLEGLPPEARSNVEISGLIPLLVSASGDTE